VVDEVEQGQVLGGRFRLTEPFAADPLLEVWRAEDVELRRDVVVNLLLPRWLDDEEMVERFRFEALAAARLVHENVVRTYDVEYADGRLFAVSEYVAGPMVADLLEEAPLPATVVAAIGQQAAAGLAAMHAEGLLHGSICPTNLLVAPTGRLCIIDFGSVRPLDVDEELPDPVFPEPGVRDYWPPERRAGAPPDDRGDVYGLGLVLWEALTGAAEAGEVGEQRPVRRLLAGLPGGDDVTPRLREILGAATADDPERRPSAAELGDSLVEICGERPQLHLEDLVVDSHQAP
jgi:eukaryotic-like serine/threonine-protein kinase